MLPLIIGIYTIENIINGKLYVGYSKDIDGRWASHRKELRKNKHGNHYLQSAWNKYGEENFKFEILEECEEQFLTSEEHWWCNILNTHNRKHGYNTKPTHPHIRNTGCSNEAKIKISESLKGRKLSEEIKNKLSIIGKEKYRTDEKIREQLSKMSKMPKRKRGKNTTPITEEYKQKQRKRMLLVPKDEINSRLNSPEVIAKRNQTVRRPLLQYDLQNNIIAEWEYSGIAATTLQLSRNCINNCLYNKRPYYKGYIWKYKYPKHKQYTQE